MRRFVVSIGMIALMSFTVPVAAADDSVPARPTRTVTLERWMRSVCTGLIHWGEAIAKLEEKIQGALTDLDAGKVSAEKAKSSLLRAATEETKATDRLIAKVKRTGTPQAANGASVATSFQETLTDFRGVAVEQQRSYSKLKTEDRKASSERAQEIQVALGESIIEIGDPLEGPRADAEFAAALNSEPVCTALLPQFIPTDFVVGDCIEASSPDALLDEHEKVPCSKSHRGEVYAVTNHPATAIDPFPGEPAINTFAEAACATEFKVYVGTDFESSDLSFWYQTPDKDTWPLGDRQVVCVIDHEDGSRMRRSVRGTAAN